MKVKIKHNFYYVDEDEELNEISTIIFEKDKPYEVVYVFEHQRWGVNDHTVVVIINENGDAMSVSFENCQVVKESEVE